MEIARYAKIVINERIKELKIKNMKKVFYPLACCMFAAALTSCGGAKKADNSADTQSDLE